MIGSQDCLATSIPVTRKNGRMEDWKNGRLEGWKGGGWTWRAAVRRGRDTDKTPTIDPHLVSTNKASFTLRGAEGPGALQVEIKSYATPIAMFS
jgi:hypothetical protein